MSSTTPVSGETEGSGGMAILRQYARIIGTWFSPEPAQGRRECADCVGSCRSDLRGSRSSMVATTFRHLSSHLVNLQGLCILNVLMTIHRTALIFPFALWSMTVSSPLNG